MAKSSFRNNPLIAAVLGSVVPGLGHLYLRRWLRALGWLGSIYAVLVLFVPETTAVTSGSIADQLSMFLLVLISAASVLDAYSLAKTATQTNGTQTAQRRGTDGNDTLVACPACGKEIDPDIGFCHWCATEVEARDGTELRETASNDTN